jgi:hypothetical protein
MAEIYGAEKLIAAFGRFPSFHDSEVVTLLLDRDSLSLTLVLLVPHFPDGELKCYEVTIRFSDVESLELQDFNYQNVISYLAFEKRIQPKLYSQEQVMRIAVELVPSFGLAASFNCRDVEFTDIHSSGALIGSPPYTRGN